ncbi:MAG: hypothetical protein LPK45_08280 [Bacteroidota bacterium]|nr:hypothetical protein [Bacteroidota bacterium]MDX5431065.1 hypothetical protein [Bacteroidota bacterium]MDX5469819.1 hypothetical protein [Bacteroidota bacterium]
MAIAGKAQPAILAKQDGNKHVYLLQAGAVVDFMFVGYSGRLQQFKGSIDSIGFDSVYLHETKLRHAQSMAIAIKDIRGFRAYSLGRTLGKLGAQLSLTGANLVFYYGVIAPAALGIAPAILISAGTGIVSYWIIQSLFPESIKKTTENGWSFQRVER